MEKKSLKDLFRPEIRAIKAYEVPDAHGMIKLDAMENPYSMPMALVKEWLGVLRDVSLNRYPDANQTWLRKELKQHLKLVDGLDVLFGNGSDELIQILMLALNRPGAVVMAPEPSFVMYKMAATFTQMQYVGVPLTEDFDIDADAFIDAINTHQPALIFLAYPNNPTANTFSREAVNRILSEAPGVVVVDEAYAAYAKDSYLDALTPHTHFMVMRTFSKTGLAGLRLGYLVGKSESIAELNKVRMPYNINSLTQASVHFALQHNELFKEQAQRIRRERERVMGILKQITEIDLYPSEANFILIKPKFKASSLIYSKLKAQNILVKDLGESHPALYNCLRITIGKLEENEHLIAALRDVL